MPPTFQSIFKRHILLLLAGYMLAINSSAQQIDSMENLIRSKQLTDTERVDALNILSRDITFANPVKSAQLASEALQTSLRINYKAGQAYSYRILASIFSSNNYNIISVEYIRKALKIFESINDSAGIANCYITQGHMYRRSGNRTKEIEFHKRSFELFSRLKIPSRIAVAAHNLGESYQLVNEFQKSRDLTLYAIHLNDSLKNESVLSNCYKVMGKLEVAAGNLTDAELYFKKVLDISKKLGDNSQKIATIESLVELASLYKRNGNSDLQLSYLNAAASFAQKNLLQDYLENIYSDLIILHAGQKEQVLKYTNEYKSVSDSVATIILKNKTDLDSYGLEVYEFLENETRNREREFLLQENKIQHKNFFLMVSLVSGLLFAIMAIILLRLLRKQKKSEIEIKNKTEQLRELAAHLQTIREQERTTIAGEIHEELGQNLTVIKMDISWLTEKLAKTNDLAATKKVEELSGIIDNSIKTVRRISTSLRPGMLDDIGLPVAIKWELSEFEKKHPIKSVFKESGDTFSLTDPVKTGLFRIFQEALLRIGQHANAKNILVKLLVIGEEVTLIIKDDGKKTKEEKGNTKENIDFLGMKERCYMMNGSFEIHTSPESGTTLTVKIPLP